ncbi:ribosomal protein S5 domain 2-like protein [Ascodesmis nigricans]|uniref:Ribosomal RNA-processing protein 43 n=1 Tax=Ascodesmis nigricans TaxID=341454 RepID=A0A4V3SJQ4_9PEZI|nr:ribosomal protein S5 domain 2-like protein [Ascodesmis nigricans]
MTSTEATETTLSGLTFPAPVFRQIAPQKYLLRHLQSTPSTRPSSRRPDEFRPATLHANALSHAHGSAVVRMGDTAVVAGVRGEVLNLLHGEGKERGAVKLRFEEMEELEEDDDDQGETVRGMGLVVPNLELGTGCTHNYHPGPPSDFAQSTAERLRSLLLDTLHLIPTSTLRITHLDPATGTTDTKAFWVLYIDIVCISLDGNILDAALAATVAALKATKLPIARWDADKEQVVCSRDETRKLDISGGLAFTASFGIVGHKDEEEQENGGDATMKKWVLCDLDEFEEEVVTEKVMVCIRDGEKIAKLEKAGGVVAGTEEMMECVRRAKERYRELEKLVSAV